MPHIISPISIDLGAKNTGVFSASYTAGEIPDASCAKLYTVLIPQDGSKLVWSQSSRTSRRHATRNRTRSRFAKRLLMLILKARLGREPEKHEREAINSLLNRRGYNRLEVETNFEEYDEIPPAELADIFPEHFNSTQRFSEQVADLTQDLSKVRNFLETPLLESSSARSIVKGLPDHIDKPERTLLANALAVLVDEYRKLLNELDFGHRHRTEYFKKVSQEIAKDSRLQRIVSALEAEPLARLVCNVSNFQLRTLRWYFNDASKRRTHNLDSKYLKTTIVRWLKGWTVRAEDVDQFLIMLQEFTSTDDIISTLLTLNPEHTIPPYENQKNRRPPKDRTLLLSPESLTAKFGSRWRKWSQKLASVDKKLADGLDNILIYTDRQSRRNKSTRLSLDVYKDAYVLHRALDRTKLQDPHGLRLIGVSPTHTNRVQNSIESVTRLLGASERDLFLKLLKSYYEEVKQARSGLWSESADTLFECANINPPSKKRILNILVGNVLGVQLDDAAFDAFKTECWGKRLVGRSTPKGACQRIEEARKSYGNSFGYEYKCAIAKLCADGKASLTAEEKKLVKIYHLVTNTSEVLKDYFGLDDAKFFNNPFSLSQLFNLIETKVDGFSSCSLAVHLENAWRMQTDSEGVANASRLTVNSIRPFDGMLRRVLDHTAARVARAKLDELLTLKASVGDIVIPIAIEDNQFNFALGMSDIKKNSRAKQKAKDGLERQSVQWKSKAERIRESSQGICAYTGQSIGRDGEVDHIVPRALSRDRSGTIFNSEVNLIWVSQKGNQDKKDQKYSLSDLHGGYLEKIFGTRDIQHIERHIETTIATAAEYLPFDELSKEQQNAYRHALFMAPESDAFRQTMSRLATRQRTLVNGTQAYFVKTLIKLLKQLIAKHCPEHLDRLKFTAARVNGFDVSTLRELLSSRSPEWKKPAIQGAMSHPIDALCAFVVATAVDPGFARSTGLNDVLSGDLQLVERLIPRHSDVIHVESKARYNKANIESQQLFKDSMYAENFLKILLGKRGLWVGFDFSPHRKIEVQDTSRTGSGFEAFLKTIEPFVRFTADELLEKLNSDKLHAVDIDRDQAFEFYSKCAKESHSVSSSDDWKLIESLRYTTMRKSIDSVFYNSQKGQYVSEGEFEKQISKQVIKTALSSKLGYKLTGRLVPQFIDDWRKLSLLPEMASGRAAKEKVGFDVTGQIRQSFNSGSSRPHSKSRRVFSLPWLDNPSGGFRILRSTEEGPIRQVQAIDGTSSSGFVLENGVINWKEENILEGLASPNSKIEPLGKIAVRSDDYVAYDHWVDVGKDVAEVERVRFAPGTKDRMFIEVTQSFETFLRWCDLDPKLLVTEIGAEMKPDKSNFASVHNSQLLGKPRSNLFVTSLGSNVTYWYRVDSTSSAMKAAYQEHLADG